MDRRGFLAGLATSVAGVLAGCGSGTNGPSTLAAARVDPTFAPPERIVRVPVPQGTITMLPAGSNLVALTVDDGTDSEVLKAYLVLARRTGLRLTFFANGSTPSWTENAPLLRPLVDRGQAIICNHTWSHSDLTQLSNTQIADEVQRNENFLTDLYGVNGRPFLRPPYGNHDARVDQMIGALGYPAVTMWWGSLGDSTAIPSRQVLANAEQWLHPRRLVIGHANHPGVLSELDRIVDIIAERRLQPVHLADIYDVAQLPPVPPFPVS
ncbi:MAG: polysaccharide deacetylase family protein [Marmoricola sp.]